MILIRVEEKKIHDFHHVPGDKFSSASHAQPKTGIRGVFHLARLNSFDGESAGDPTRFLCPVRTGETKAFPAGTFLFRKGRHNQVNRRKITIAPGYAQISFLVRYPPGNKYIPCVRTTVETGHALSLRLIAPFHPFAFSIHV